MIEIGITKAMLPSVGLGRIAAVTVAMNLVTSLLLMAVFWSLGGVPGSNERLL